MAILKAGSSGGGIPSVKTVRAINTAKKADAADAKQTANLLKAFPYTPTPAPPQVITPPSVTPSVPTIPVVVPEPYIPKQPDPPDPPPPPTGKDLGVVKTPSRDVTRLSDLVQQIPSYTISRIGFEQLSAIELSQVLTSNTVEGINQKYSIISNLSDVRKRFNTSRQLSIMNKLSPMTSVFAIDIDSKIPGRSYILANNLNRLNYYLDENNSLTSVERGGVYIDTNGDLVIEFDNMKDDEIVQVQINSDGTIYEVT